MNGTPTPDSMQPPKTSALAVWSLVLGIFSLVCFSIFTGIPAIICGHVARSKIKNSLGALAGGGMAMAGLIMGYLSVVLLIALIPIFITFGLPAFAKARDTAITGICVYNLQQIDSAIERWAAEGDKPQDATPTRDDIMQYLPGATFPVCPARGEYTLNTVGEHPTCSVPEHEFPGTAETHPEHSDDHAH